MQATLTARRPLGESTIAAAAHTERAGGHERGGRRLAGAFQALEGFPALVESRDRLLTAAADGDVRAAEMATIVESDVAIALTVLRAANAQPARKRADTACTAIERLGADTVRRLVEQMPTFDFFERSEIWGSLPSRLRAHALGTQRAADRIAAETGYPHRDRLALASLLHDIGKPVLAYAYPGYPARVHGDARTPVARVSRERKELGFDHALLGGVVARRWGLPSSIALTLERHHHQAAAGEAAIVQLADALTHYEQDALVQQSELLAAARTIGLGRDALRRILTDLSCAASPRAHGAADCPLSSRELAALRGLARGLVYKQIGQELAISASTIRSHLHAVYKKLGAVDRAQAVLIATRAGWI